VSAVSAYCRDNPTWGPPGEACPFCGLLFTDAPPALQVTSCRSLSGDELPAVLWSRADTGEPIGGGATVRVDRRPVHVDKSAPADLGKPIAAMRRANNAVGDAILGRRDVQSVAELTAHELLALEHVAAIEWHLERLGVTAWAIRQDDKQTNPEVAP
jgi:hypothetical protein